MALQISLTAKNTSAHQVYLIDINKKFKLDALPKEELELALKLAKDKASQYQVSLSGKTITLLFIDTTKEDYLVKEAVRKAACSMLKNLNSLKATSFYVESLLVNEDLCAAFVEGAILSNYQFLKYKTKEIKKNTLTTIEVNAANLSKKKADEISIITEANLMARTLINEPLSFLTATQLSAEIVKAGKEAGFKTEIFDKKKITALKMGGLLSVNKGSVDPPTFSVLEYKPTKAKNKQPVVLVGKGVVYDTGGLSLKPTAGSMDMMKCDMSGAATVIGAMQAIAKLKLPVYVVGLIPATDNRPGGNAYVPGDVVEMMNGIQVEVLNTDAEGRMILGDALAYASKYKPALVFDFATLTGAAKAAIGGQGTIFMGTADEKIKQAVRKSGFETYERVVEFPFWEEYGTVIKSDVADIKNVGGPEAGMITAGKFLEHFTDYPWLHFDIAGPAYLMTEDSYRGKYGTGVGIRMLVDFFKKY